MHILLLNDDGPPGPAAPYFLPFVRTLESHNHTVSVVVPSAQRSWIGKAHMITETTSAYPYFPNDIPVSDRSTSHPWYLVTGTPAACTQLGANHLFTDRGPLDLVLAGPNYGTNITNLFAISSGTLGAALEGALCGFKAISVSFHYFSPVTADDIVLEACKHAVRVVEHLASKATWATNRCYSVNVPLEPGDRKKQVYWCRLKDVHWLPGPTVFREVEPSQSLVASGVQGPVRSFRWDPDMSFGTNTRTKDQEIGTDVWATSCGYTSVVALDASFRQDVELQGRIDLG